MTGVETLAWLVLAFTDGSDCLLQGSFHWLPEGRAFVREDGWAVQSQQEGGYVVFWSDHRWVAIKIPTGARSLSYRWGRTVAFVNGDSVKVQHGTIMGEFPRGSSMTEHENVTPFSQWRTGNIPPVQRSPAILTYCDDRFLGHVEPVGNLPQWSQSKKVAVQAHSRRDTCQE